MWHTKHMSSYRGQSLASSGRPQGAPILTDTMWEARQYTRERKGLAAQKALQNKTQSRTRSCYEMKPSAQMTQWNFVPHGCEQSLAIGLNEVRHLVLFLKSLPMHPIASMDVLYLMLLLLHSLIFSS